MERHFACTRCGLCCTGLLPLTVDEALARADRFPLALVWTTVRPGARSFDRVRRLGIEVDLDRRRRVAVLVTPMAYLPPTAPCPDLVEGTLCGAQAAKPLRCRAMPFDPLRAPDDQGDLLIPRPGWTCDISAAAPVVYRDKTPVAPDDMQREHDALLAQAPLLQTYARHRLAVAPAVLGELARLDARPQGGRLALPFSGLLSRLPGADVRAFVRDQAGVMARYAAQTPPEGNAKSFHRYYREVLVGMEKSVGA